MSSSESEKAAYWMAKRGGTTGRQAERKATAGRALCSWVTVNAELGTRAYRWHVPPSHKSDRRKKIEARWALRKRERAMRGAA